MHTGKSFYSQVSSEIVNFFFCLLVIYKETTYPVI